MFKGRNMIDRNVFVNDAVLSLCRSKTDNSLLINAYNCLKKYIPIDRITMACHIQATHTMIRLGSVENGLLDDSVYFFELPDYIEKQLTITHDNIFFHGYNDDYFSQAYKEFIQIKGNSDLCLQLKDSESVVGCVIIRAFKENAYNETHVELLRDLIVPFTMAFFNMLAHKNIFLKCLERSSCPQKSLSPGGIKPIKIIGKSAAITNVIELAKSVAQFSSSVLITGETGVGKEIFANLIHFSSERRNQPFVKINCGALPETLIDNELFGHEKGAFTGADSAQKGRFELAQNGTLFLDEIGELPLNLQTKLLRVLQFGEIERLGGGKTIKIDVRIISATNKNLHKMIEEGKFREDLFWRLNVFPIEVPPLRSRREDIPLLVNFITKKKCSQLGIDTPPSIDAELTAKLLNYDWPGNVREMENLIERELIMLQKSGFKFAGIQTNADNKTPKTHLMEHSRIDCVMREHILNTLQLTKGKISGKNGAAEILGMHTNTLRYRMKKLGLLKT